MNGLAFGITGPAEQALKSSQASRDIYESGLRTEDFFQKMGRATQRGSRRGATVGGLLSILGMAALTAAFGPAAGLPLGRMILSGALTGIGSKVGATQAVKKAGIDKFDERFHRRIIQRGKEDVRQVIGEEAFRMGAIGAAAPYAAQTTPGLQGNNLLDMIMNLTGLGRAERPASLWSLGARQ